MSNATVEGRSGPILALWMGAILAFQALSWASGARTAALAEAVERGAARAERAKIAEVGDDLVRKAVRLQQATLPFWTTLTLIGDFAIAPLSPALRSLAAAALLSSLAALVGRPPGFGAAMVGNAKAQGYWVLGLAVRVGLETAMRRTTADTSLALALPPGAYPAALWVALRQLDAFALLGWAAMARGSWRRGQANLATACLACLALWLAESTFCALGTLATGAGMRLALLPE